MKNSISFLVLFAMEICIAQKPYELKGEISGASGKDSLYMQYQTPDGGWKSRPVAIKQGHFSITGESDEPLPLYLYNNPEFSSDGKSSVLIYVEPGTQIAKADFGDLSRIEVKGSKTQDEQLALMAFKSSIMREQDSVAIELEKTNLLLEKAASDVEKARIKQQSEKLYKRFDSLRIAEIKSELEFFSTHRNSFAAPDPLLMRMGQGAGVPFRDEIAALAKNLSEEVKNSSGGKNLMKRVANYENSKVGGKARDFVLTDINGNKIGLSDYSQRNYVLLDFWASYCAPCRAEYPELKQVFASYPELVVVNVSKDQNLESWRKAIAKDGIGSWRHAAMQANPKTDILADYNVIFIPVKVLVAPDGTIVARWEGSGDEKVSELKDKLKQILN